MLLPLALLSALYFKTSDGNIYHTIDEIPPGMCLLNNAGEELVYEVPDDEINDCIEKTLQPGCYRAELRGGIGLQNEYCQDVAAQDIIETISAIFSINEPTKVYVLRGADGNPGGVNVVGGYSGAFGGGASGVDSILVVGDRVWRASGGAGTSCIMSMYNSANMNVGGYTGGVGIGGDFDDVLLNQGRIYQIQKQTHVYVTAGGGGASPNGAGGTDWITHYNFINGDEYVNAGTNGTDERGGDGGDIYVCKDISCTSMVAATGGVGGETIKYECGGQTAKSYGGGGGGGTRIVASEKNINGGKGGTGSSGTSDVSFVRIYKI